MSNLLNLNNEAQDSEAFSADDAMDNLAARAKGGANWFYWIAGLSAVNTLLFLSDSNVSFLAGLGITQVADGLIEGVIQAGGPPFFRGVAIFVDVVVVIFFALFGYYSGRLFFGAFLAGTIIYALDGLLLFALGDILAAGFHIFALIFIIRGLVACRSLNVAAAKLNRE